MKNNKPKKSQLYFYGKKVKQKSSFEELLKQFQMEMVSSGSVLNYRSSTIIRNVCNE